MLCDTIGHAIAAAVNEMVIMGLAIMMLFSMPHDAVQHAAVPDGYGDRRPWPQFL